MNSKYAKFHKFLSEAEKDFDFVTKEQLVEVCRMLLNRAEYLEAKQKPEEWYGSGQPIPYRPADGQW